MAIERREKIMGFYERAGIVCRRIPWGRTATYGQIALLCGKPQNARQVGYALNRGKLGKVPAHRVVNAQGILTGASSFETYEMQKLLLEREGIEVCQREGRWQIDQKKYGWKHTLEEALELAEEFERRGI